MVKSNKGIVIFSGNNESIDYNRITEFNKSLIENHLNVPITILDTEKSNNKRAFRWDTSEIQKISWHNTNRCDVFDLSPYDETIVLDADYLIFSNNLNKLWGVQSDFLCGGSVFDLTHTNSFQDDRILGYSIPRRWATVIYFKKTKSSKTIFEMMKKVRDNYRYYSQLFGFKANTYRNDFALSVALQLIGGYDDKSHHFHFPIYSLSPQEKIIKLTENGIVFEYISYVDGERKTLVSKIDNLDVHIMNKKQLVELI